MMNEVVMKQGIREIQISKLFGEFWRLKNLNELYGIYPKISSGLEWEGSKKGNLAMCNMNMALHSIVDFRIEHEIH